MTSLGASTGALADAADGADGSLGLPLPVVIGDSPRYRAHVSRRMCACRDVRSQHKKGAPACALANPPVYARALTRSAAPALAAAWAGCGGGWRPVGGGRSWGRPPLSSHASSL